MAIRNQIGSSTDVPRPAPGFTSSAVKINHSAANHKLDQLASRFCATTLVFQDGHVAPADSTSTFGEWLAADYDSVNSLFASYPIHREIFLRFLDDEFLGLILVDNNEWISYGWSSQPGQKQPPHVPPWVSHLAAYWIFYCHTKEEFRGRGLYKQLLARIVQKAQRRQANPTVYVDALPANIASRRSILSAGFNPAGVLTTYKFWVPHFAHVAVAGSWHRNENHPPL